MISRPWPLRCCGIGSFPVLMPRPRGSRSSRSSRRFSRWCRRAKVSGCCKQAMVSDPPIQEQASTPRQVCGYALVRWLKDGRTALCRSEGNRLLVVKKLDQDCLLEGDLHPDVRERLARIRELAHGQVATLI